MHKRTIALGILAILVVLIPSLKMLTYIYYILASFIILLLFAVAMLLITDLPLSIRISIIVVVFAVFRINIDISARVLWAFVKFGVINPVSTRVNDTPVREYIDDIFSRNFKMCTNFENLPEKPSIIIANYCKDRMENISCLLIPRNISIMMRRELRVIGLHKILKWPLFTDISGSYENTKKQISDNILENRSVFSYVTTKTTSITPNLFIKIRTGMFSIAKELNVQVTPIVFDYIDTSCGFVPFQRYNIHVGDSFYVDSVGLSKQKVMRFFREKMTEFISTKYTNLE